MCLQDCTSCAVQQSLGFSAVVRKQGQPDGWVERVALAVELDRATRAADPRVRQVSSADYADSRVEVALATTTGLVSSRRRTTAFLSVDAIAGEGTETQTGTGIVLIFATGATGDVAPMSTYRSPGAVTGLGIVP